MSAPRPKRTCVREAEASKKAADESESSESSESSGSQSEFEGRSAEGRSESSESGESGESEFEFEDEEDEKDGARKLKREHCKRLAEVLGVGMLEMQRGARVLVALSRLGDSGVSRFLDAVLSRCAGSSLRKAAGPMLEEAAEAAKAARPSYWASPVVDSLAAVFGGPC
jgi:hypothetical protein